jgi:hypothetical protein
MVFKMKPPARIRIPLENLTQEERKEIDNAMGKTLIIIADEPCLTCGHKIRIQRIERSDGQKELVQECLYCAVRVKTSANQRSP